MGEETKKSVLEQAADALRFWSNAWNEFLEYSSFVILFILAPIGIVGLLLVAVIEIFSNI